MENGARPSVRTFAFAVSKQLAKVLLPLGFGLGDFLETAKAAFVSAASDRIEAQGDRISTSRVAAITGLSRPEVARIRSNRATKSLAAGRQPIARVMHAWFTDPAHVDSGGKPKPLPLLGENSFEALARRFGGDVPPKALLSELLAAGMAEVRADHWIVPLNRYFKSAGHGVDLEDLAADIGVLFASSASDRTSPSTTLRRVSVAFDGPISAGVRRNVILRTERFLDALSEYLHTATGRSGPDGEPDGPKSTFNVLVAQSDFWADTVTPGSKK